MDEHISKDELLYRHKYGDSNRDRADSDDIANRIPPFSS
jgi:hypothetical protein